MSDLKQSRMEFEKWATWDAAWENQINPPHTQKILNRYLNFFNDSTGEYYNDEWQLAWETWQAARTAGTKEKP